MRMRRGCSKIEAEGRMCDLDLPANVAPSAGQHIRRLQISGPIQQKPLLQRLRFWQVRKGAVLAKRNKRVKLSRGQPNFGSYQVLQPRLALLRLAGSPKRQQATTVSLGP